MPRGRRKYSVGVITAFLVMWGTVWGMAQNQPPSIFTPIQVIGKARPQDVRYSAPYERFAWVNAQGELALVDAVTYTEIAILTPDPLEIRLNDYKFSPDGRWLAVARGKQVDLWNTQTAELAANFETDSTFGLEGPLWFSDDSRQLVFQSRVPAPQSTRRSENDTDLVPWVWDLVAARDEGPSELPNRVIAQPMFDYRNGFIMGKGRKAVTGLPARLRTVELTADGIQLIDEIDDPNRIEIDPIAAWVSETDGWMVIRTSTSVLAQVDPTTGNLLPIQTDIPLQLITERTVDAFHVSQALQPIGPIGDKTQIPLRARLLGEDYRSYQDYDPITMYLLDVLQPITPQAGVPGLLIYTRNDRTGEGAIEFLNVPNSRVVTLHPNGRELLIQDAEGDQKITVYTLDTGTVEQVYYPDQTDPDVVSYNSDGSALIVGFERFDTITQAYTFYDPYYFVNMGQIFFTHDGQSVISLENGTYQQWEIDTGTRRRQDFYYARGETIQTAPDGTRLLTRLDLPSGQTVYEVVDIAGGTRPLLTMALPLNTSVVNVYPDAVWEQFFVLISDNTSNRAESRIQGALYRIGSSDPVWTIGNGDIPIDAFEVRWVDANTLGFVYANQTLPLPRIENIQYAASGLPACLVEGLPDDGARWLGLWDFFNQSYGPTTLDEITLRLCGIVQQSDSPSEADAALEAVLLSPTPSPTEVFGTPRVARIPGIPECITQRFTGEALKYAQDWRTITAEMTEAQIAELAVLVCQGLTGEAAPSIGIQDTSDGTRHLLLDVNTLTRTIHSGTLPPLPARPNWDLIAQAWRQEKRFEIGNYAVSPDGRRVVRADGTFITVYSIDPDYQALAATATATYLPQGTPQKRLSMRPQATSPAQMIQATFMPTFTPTWTPTPVPLPLSTAVPATDAEMTCPAERTPLASLSAEERPKGVLYVSFWDAGSQSPWQFDLTTGEIVLRDDIPQCNYAFGCSASPNGQWILYEVNGSTWVSRWDGGQATELFTPLDSASKPSFIAWVGPHTLEWRIQDTKLDEDLNPIYFIQRFDTATQILTSTVVDESRDAIPQINNLSTQLVTRQPIKERYELLSVDVREGRRYYWHDRDTGDISLFATLSFDQGLSYEWRPTGDLFYYGVGSIQYSYDPATKANISAAYFSGLWSPDGQEKVEAYIPSAREVYDYDLAKRELPRLVIWDSEANTRTRHCLPGTDPNQAVSVLSWSPDGRYVLLQASLVIPDTYEVSRPALLILDTDTGRVIDLGKDIQSVTVWTTLTTGDSQ